MILYLAVVGSLALHLVFLNLQPSFVSEKKKDQDPHKFNLESIRTVGEKNQESKNMAHIPKQIKSKNPVKKESPKGERLSLSDLQAQNPSISKTSNAKPSPPPERGQTSKPIDALSLNKKTVKDFMRQSPNAGSSGEYANAFGDSNVLVELEVPQGVPEDELNKYELVFYSFRKRTALNYVNSFYTELTDFQRSHPHLRFPVTPEKDSMTGRITYDEEGNIVRIKMLKWTNEKKLQDFFLQVLKNMNSLPNPPEIIIKDGEFHVYYSLTVNG